MISPSTVEAVAKVTDRVDASDLVDWLYRAGAEGRENAALWRQHGEGESAGRWHAHVVHRRLEACEEWHHEAVHDAWCEATCAVIPADAYRELLDAAIERGTHWQDDKHKGDKP